MRAQPHGTFAARGGTHCGRALAGGRARSGGAEQPQVETSGRWWVGHERCDEADPRKPARWPPLGDRSVRAAAGRLEHARVQGGGPGPEPTAWLEPARLHGVGARWRASWIPSAAAATRWRKEGRIERAAGRGWECRMCISGSSRESPLPRPESGRTSRRARRGEAF